MSHASALDRLSVRYFQTSVDNLEVERTPTGGAIIRAFPVFRTGTFKDSWGDQHTWETEHLQQMVFHYGLLKGRNILPNVPVRNQHKSLFGGGGEVVGYVADLYTIGGYEDGYERLVADLEITEPDAFDKIDRGTWRSRSAEIGFYETNDEVMYWPVFMGVAFVDIPAVEGLESAFSKYRKSKNKDEYIPIRDDEEGATVPKTKTHSQGTPPADPAVEGGDPNANPAPGTDNPATQPAEDEDEGAGEGEGGTTEHASGQPSTPPPTTPPSPPSTPPTPPSNPTPSSEHGQAGGTFQFQINGQPTNDFAAVQAHISNLETVIQENSDQARRDFVSGLASDSRIAATQVESMTEHALSLNDSQYESFRSMWENAPQSPLFAQHGNGVTNPDGSSEPSEVDTLRERVAMHRRSGMSEEKIKATESYEKLMALTDGKG